MKSIPTVLLMIILMIHAVQSVIVKVDVDEMEYCLPELGPCVPRPVFIPLRNMIIADEEGLVSNMDNVVLIYRCSSSFSCCSESYDHSCSVSNTQDVCLGFNYLIHNGDQLEKRFIVVQNHTGCSCQEDIQWTNPLVVERQKMLTKCP